MEDPSWALTSAPFSASQAERLLKLLPTARLVALGGATEVTVWSNFFQLRSVDPQYHVYDETAVVESPALIGLPGQLHISGRGLALGYIGAPELTAERFGHSNMAGQVAYNTGDLVRFVPESPWGLLPELKEDTSLVLEFLGRADFQVKVRGHRIELQEIEEAARSAREVQSAAVIVKDQKLVAFVTPQDLNVVHLTQTLREVLPQYMVPDLILPRDQLPLTTSGKVDRKALEGSLEDLHKQQREIREPQSAMEVMVCEAFQKILGLERLSLDDDFFQLLDATSKSSQLFVLGLELC
eukprot:Skav219368  [mRNA]  locus=scaffold76:622827:624476:- [translate_table: standard]